MSRPADVRVTSILQPKLGYVYNDTAGSHSPLFGLMMDGVITLSSHEILDHPLISSHEILDTLAAASHLGLSTIGLGSLIP